MSEFRQHPRKPIAVLVKADDGEGSGALYFESGDLSVGGAFLQSDLLLEEGETLSLELKLPSGLVRARAQVTWVKRFPGPDRPAGMGVRFEALAEADRVALEKALA